MRSRARCLLAERARFDKALQEYVEAQLFNAERAESHANLGGLYAARGEAEKSRAEYERAIALDAAFFPAVIALAEIARASGDEPGAEATLRKALARNPETGAIHHALALSLIRQRRAEGALSEFAESAKLAPENARFAYVYGVALHDLGRREQALKTLRDALARFPNDGDILYALASYEIEAKDEASAVAHLEALMRLEPENEEAQALLRSSAADGDLATLAPTLKTGFDNAEPSRLNAVERKRWARLLSTPSGRENSPSRKSMLSRCGKN